MILRHQKLLAGAMLVACLGCGDDGPEIAFVKGKVTMDNKPLANATVVFIPPNGRTAGARTDADGNYVLNFTEGRQGAMPGKNSVRITTLRDADQDENGKSIPGSKETVPMEYNVNSKLEFNVESGKENVADFDLKSGGRVASSE